MAYRDAADVEIAAKLLEHTGTVHRWAARMVRDRAPERLDPRALDLGLPEDSRGYADWLGAGAALLLDALDGTDPDAPMWAWGADQHARFWARRMLHETTIHRVDVQLALGVEPTVEAATAADGIDELLENLPTAGYFRPRVAELRGAGESIALRSTDRDEHWLVTLGPEGFTWERGGVDSDVGPVTVAVSATTESLLLLLYTRRPPGDERVRVTGSEPVLAHWLECSVL